MFTEAVTVSHWMKTSLISKPYLAQQVYNAFVFQNYSHAELIYLQIRLNKNMSFLQNTKKLIELM